MAYFANVSIDYPCSAHEVYEALCDLGTYTKWNSGLISISSKERLAEGLVYEATSMVLNRVNTSTIKVIELVEDRKIVLESVTGLVQFQSLYEIQATKTGSTLHCHLTLNFRRKLFNLAQPVAEAIAENWIAHDLKTLRDMLTSSEQ